MSLITYVTRIHFADRILEDALAEELVRCRSRRPLIVARADRSTDAVIERLWDALPVAAEPVRFAPTGSRLAATELTGGRLAATELDEARDLHRGSACDAVIGFGGSLALDLARLLGTELGAAVIAVPTRTESVGLGPLWMPFGSRTGRDGKVPDAILCDATLTLGADARTTAEAGMVALVQCLEAYLGTTFNPPADGIALEGLRRAARYLEPAVANPQDLEARRELLAAALNAGLATQKGLGGIEAAARALAAAADAAPVTRHGACHAALLPEVLAFNAPAIADRFAAIAAALGLPRGGDVGGDTGAAVGSCLTDLARRIELPARLGPLGVDADWLVGAASTAAADVANRTNPRHATAKDYHLMMRAVL